MKYIVLFLMLLLTTVKLKAQKATIDSLYKELSYKKPDTDKATTLNILSNIYLDYKPDSALFLAKQAYALSIKNKFLKGQSGALNSMASAYYVMHNYPKAIAYYVDQIKIEEKRKNSENTGNAYLSIAQVYNSEKDASKALFYALKADSIAKVERLSELLLFSKLNIGDIYEKDNQLGLAMINTYKAFELSLLQNRNDIRGVALNNLGNIYFKQQAYGKSLNNYKQSIPFLEAAKDYNNLSECYIGLAKISMEFNKIDSAIFYAKKAYKLSIGNEFMAKAIEASKVLVKLYKRNVNIDSAFAFQEVMVNLIDSIDSKARAKQVESITIAEDIRQTEIIEAREKEAKERTQKLQLLAIGVFIPIFFFISIFLSRRKVNQKIIAFSGTISLLLLFEYLTLFIHPFVAEKSHHSPLIEIVVFVIIASLLTPAHHKIEHWLMGKLSKIREHHSQLRQKQIDELKLDSSNEE